MKNIKNLNYKKLIKKIIRNIIYFIIGLGYTYYLLNKLIVKLFLKLPTKGKVITVYLFLIIAVIGWVRPTATIVETQTIEKIIEVAESVVPETEVVEEETPETTTNIFNSEIENLIYSKALEVGMTEDQAIIALSISAHETGNWTSSLYLNNHNVGGLYDCNNNKFKSYTSIEEGVNAFVNLLKTYYFDLGYDTIEKIGAKYCPVGAKNDPQGLNKNWVSGVSAIYSNYYGK